MKNKQIDSSLNQILNLGVTDPFVSAKREGYIIPSTSDSGSLRGCLKGIPSQGTYSYIYDGVGTEGYVSRFSTSIVEKLGYGSDTINVISRREWATRFKIRVRSSSTANINMYIGFTDQSFGVVSTDPTNPFTSVDSGVMVGFNPSATQFLVFNHDGGGGTPNVQSFGTGNNKDNAWHTYEIIMSDTNIICKLNDANAQTLTTQIPALTTDLKLVIQLHSLDTTAKVFDISKASFSSDFV